MLEVRLQQKNEVTAGALIPFGAASFSTSGNASHSLIDNSR